MFKDLSVSCSRTASYGFIGALLSMGAPLGLLTLRTVRQESWQLSLDRVAAEIGQDLEAYSYISISTALAFTAFGMFLGRRVDLLAERSETDDLTGLYNARGLSRRLNEEMTRFARYRQPLALLLLDVDGLKDINDQFGHPAGNSALRQVATAMRDELRASDVGARWGGDEFAILAPNTSSSAAEALAERVRSSISSAQFAWQSSVSLGIAAISAPTSQTPISADAIMQIADAALYEAKNRGRNSIALRTDSCTDPQPVYRAGPPP
jgi:diguanylate cyclase (GGDEF)-like protein